MRKVPYSILVLVFASVVAGLSPTPAAAGEAQCSPARFGPEGLALEVSVTNLGRFFLPLEQDRLNSMTIDIPGSGEDIRAAARLQGNLAEVEIATAAGGARRALVQDTAGDVIGSYRLPVEQADSEGVVLEGIAGADQTLQVRVVSSRDVVALGCCEVGDTICCPDAGTCVRCNGTSTCCTKKPPSEE